tara:strand:+ start:2802 stop:3032 length:231 start_codon:yes stop_codon:yes gene_type:complete
MESKKRFEDVLTKCKTAIEMVEAGIPVIKDEKNMDHKDRLYEVATNTLHYLLECSFGDEDEMKYAMELANLERLFM